jgi:heme exporter protein D
MGGYGVYVWGSYAVTFALLAIEVVMVIRRKRATARNARVSEDKLDAGNSKLETV